MPSPRDLTDEMFEEIMEKIRTTDWSESEDVSKLEEIFSQYPATSSSYLACLPGSADDVWEAFSDGGWTIVPIEHDYWWVAYVGDAMIEYIEGDISVRNFSDEAITAYENYVSLFN